MYGCSQRISTKNEWDADGHAVAHLSGAFETRESPTRERRTPILNVDITTLKTSLRTTTSLLFSRLIHISCSTSLN
jgi:hypothetical protein